MSQAQRAIIALLLLFAMWCGWQSRLSSQQSAPVTQSQNTSNRPDEKKQSQNNEGLWDWLTHDAAGFFAAWLVIIGSGQLTLFYVQLRFIRESLDDTKIAAEAAKISADAAKSQALVAERSLVDLQRALIVPTMFNGTAMIRNSRVIGYIVTANLQNVGNTTAKRHIGSANFVMWDGPLPDNFRYPDRVDVGTKTAFVGPHVQMPQPIAIAIQDIVDILNKKGRGFFYGWVEYEDIFTSTSKRRTEYCVELGVIANPHVLPEKGGPGIFEIGAYGPYNGTDDDCMYKPGQRPPIGGLPPPTQPPPEEAQKL